MGKQWKQWQTSYFEGSKITADGDYSLKTKNRLLFGRKAITNLDSKLKSRDITLLTKVCLVKAMVFPVVRYGYESWTIKKAEHQRIDAFKLWCWRRFLRVPWTARRSNQSILKGNQSWMFIGRTAMGSHRVGHDWGDLAAAADAEAVTPILWPPDAKCWLTGKDPDAGKDRRQEEKGMTEDEMVEWHYWLYGHEFEWALGVGDGQESLACYSSWGHKELDMTEWLNGNCFKF